MLGCILTFMDQASVGNLERTCTALRNTTRGILRAIVLPKAYSQKSRWSRPVICAGACTAANIGEICSRYPSLIHIDATSRGSHYPGTPTVDAVAPRGQPDDSSDADLDLEHAGVGSPDLSAQALLGAVADGACPTLRSITVPADCRCYGMVGAEQRGVAVTPALTPQVQAFLRAGKDCGPGGFTLHGDTRFDWQHKSADGLRYDAFDRRVAIHAEITAHGSGARFVVDWTNCVGGPTRDEIYAEAGSHTPPPGEWSMSPSGREDLDAEARTTAEVMQDWREERWDEAIKKRPFDILAHGTISLA